MQRTPRAHRLAVAIAVAVALGAGVLACAGGTRDRDAAHAGADGAPADDASAGDDTGRDAWVKPDAMGAIYAENCAVCHGANLEGAAQGPSLRADPLAHGASIDELVASIADGYPQARMPAWRGVIADDDLRGLAIYLAEKRRGDPGPDGYGVGAAPVVPTGIVHSELHDFEIELVWSGLEEPYSIAPMPDGGILATEKMRGLLRIDPARGTATRVTGTPRFYDDAPMRGTMYAGQGWAHEVALHPRYAENGWIYLSYGDRCDGCNAASRASGAPVSMLKLVRGRLDGARWVDEETVWEAPRESYEVGVENGISARIEFDDADRVYLTVGVLADYRKVQDLREPFGKILRVRDDGSIPEDNPFLDVPGALPAIYTLGHRNAQGLAFDRRTRTMWSSEHGPRGGDETNLVRAGANYGWPLVSLGVDYDGRPIHYAEEYGIAFDPADLTGPVLDWTPSPGLSSMVFYEGDAFPRWRGQLLQASLAATKLVRVVTDGASARRAETLLEGIGRLRDVEVAPDGTVLLLVEHRAGSLVLRLVPASPPRPAATASTPED
ncbi:MAG: PQQ-dependent sugar dehydrogenase [Myxococcota bacterium]